MKPTYISRPAQVFDIPIPSKPELSFIYNFFLKDERVNDFSPRLKRDFSKLTAREIEQSVPRYITVNWKKATFDKKQADELSVSLDSIVSNQSNIIDESNVLKDYTMCYFQDLDYLNRIGERFETSARLRGSVSGSNTDLAAQLVSSRIDNGSSAITDQGSTKIVEEQSNTIQRFLSIASQSRSLILKDGVMIEPSDASSDDQLAMAIDNSYRTGSSKFSNASPVSSAANSFRNNTKMLTPKERKDKMITQEEAEIVLTPISKQEITSEDYQVEKISHIGYVIERFEMGAQDKIENKKTIFINSPNITSYVDLEIKYGIEYTYCVKSLIIMTTTTFEPETSIYYKSKFLIASRPSTFSSVVCNEIIPPAGPADLNFYWDYQNAAMQIGWSFPINKQRDIKGWQIFRRKSLNNPFSLIAQLDFDDSVIRTPPIETVDKSLIKMFSGPTTFYIDHEFEKDSNFIYSVCSVDAHGMTSNYSQQFRVRFDRIQNKLIKELISTSGAPKQYPNMFLKNELSIDSVKSSKRTKIRVYFDPEYLKVSTRDGDDLHLLKTEKRNGLYRFMLLNTDRQLQSNFDIKIFDMR